MPGLDKTGFRPRIKDSAMILLKIYSGLTVLMTALLMIAGMDLFEKATEFSAEGSSGFGVRLLTTFLINAAKGKNK